MDFNTVQKNKLAVFFKTDNSIQNHQQSAILKKKNQPGNKNFQ